jgi:putative aldouronate transport system substrate-binding protein
MTAMKKTSPDRVEELLRIHDWIASPFGTEEYLFVEYGSEGRDYRLDGTDPILTETGNNEVQRMLVDNLAGPSGRFMCQVTRTWPSASTNSWTTS